MKSIIRAYQILAHGVPHGRVIFRPCHVRSESQPVPRLRGISLQSGFISPKEG